VSSQETHSFFLTFFSIALSNIHGITPEKKGDLSQRFDSTVESGVAHRKEGNFDQATDEFSEALDLARKMNNKEGEVKCLISLGLLYWNIGDMEESSGKYKKALFISKKFNLEDLKDSCQKALEIYRLYKEGKKFRFSGEHQKSTESFQQAINLAEKYGSEEHKLKCLRQMSFAFWALNNFKHYFDLNEEALKIARNINHKKEEGNCLNNIGIYHLKSDNYVKALPYFNDALKIAQAIKHTENESACLGNIGIIYEEIGNFKKALEYYTKALTISKQSGDNVRISADLNNIGSAYRAKGLITRNKEDFIRALHYFKDCLRLARKTKDEEAEILDLNQTEVYALNNIGFVHTDLKNYHEAMKYFNSGYEKAKEIQDIETGGMIQNNMGIAHYNLGYYDEAIKSYQKAIELANKINGRQILWEAHLGLGQCYEKKNEFSQAAMSYKRAINVIDHIRSQILLDTYKAGFLRDKLKMYEFLICLLYRMNADDPSNSYTEEIFYTVERAKSRAFLESLGESRIDIRESLNPELKKRENELSSRISFVIQELSRSGLSKKKRQVLLNKLRQAEDEYISLISRIRMEVPELANLVSAEPCDVDQIQQHLDRRTGLIEYFLGENKSFMFFITRKEFAVFSLPSRTEIEKSIKAYLKILSGPPNGEFRGSLAAKRIYRELLFPAERNIPESVENLIIVPDGILYSLPFETLIPNSRDKPLEDDYLIAKYKISYVPSSSALLFLSGNNVKHGSQKGLLAFGNPSYMLRGSSKEKKPKTGIQILREMYLDQGFDFSPLPNAEREILEISSYFAENKRDIYLKDEAREERFKEAPLKDYEIIHFACHGFLAEEFPFRSALVLSLDDDPQEDGFLQVRELYNLRLKADLVVLSACQTGKGKLERGEGILGFPRVFFYAGARSVMLTLWRINDESTAKFMSLFYRYLSEGNDKAQALRLTKLEMINSKFSHPFYWAAFILNGDSKSILNFK
jgi:CHAT domain-containing protein/Tfp pilus assembly protein PilF